MSEKIIKLSGLSEDEVKIIVPEKTIILGFIGSIAHNTYIPSTNPDSIDDKDIMGICIAPKNCYFGLQNFEQLDKQYKEWDSVVYEIRKYFRLLLKQNPNVISLLWLRPNNYIYISDIGKKILENKDIFASKEAYHSFNGYAHGQLKRMTHIGNAKLGYMGKKRYELVQKYGFDAKNAGHLIRILRMGIEFLIDGQLRVFREDAEELKDIKAGKWSLEKIEREADRLFKLSIEAYTKSPLPPKPDYKKAENLLMEILEGEISK